MKLDEHHPMNQGVLMYLRKEAPLLAAPESVRDAYYSQGSHPDIVERVWDELGRQLPRASRCLVYGTPALVHKKSGILFAICNGTQYNLRLTKESQPEALRRGLKVKMRWSTGQEMDATLVLGEDWLFGSWEKEELSWCQIMCEALDLL
jgi:hypothetical protein